MGARALATALGAIAVGGAVASALATGAKSSSSIVLGKTEGYPDSGCPDASSCEVVARVTGIQMMADDVQHPFRAPRSGQLVSWWLRLPELRKSQIKSFGRLFGGDPAGRIVVLRRGPNGRFRLIRQSPTVELRTHLGGRGRAHFRLDESLRIKEGDYVGLTAITWIPAFAVNLSAEGNTWLASRPRRYCNTPSSSDPERFASYYRRNRAHTESSTVKHYRCVYRTARLLYWARMVPDAPEQEPAGDN